MSKWVTTLRAAGDFFASVLMAKAIFLDFWREKGAFTDPASSATFFCVAKLKVLLPRSMLLLLLQLLSWWAVSATTVPMARMQQHRLLLRRPRQSTQQLAAVAGA